MTLIVFGYGSLVWKPPADTVHKTVGYVKGYVRRFAQSSNDHRGTPEHLGRVVTLVTHDEWTNLTGETTHEDERKVWGIGWTIDPEKEDQVRADLDHREKNGYTSHTVQLYNHDEDGNEIVVVEDATIYLGTDKDTFVGSEPLSVLSARIHSSAGPSGLNKDYLYELAKAVRELDPQAEEGDRYLFELERAVRALDQQGEQKQEQNEEQVETGKQVDPVGA